MFGGEAMKKLARSRVAIFGLGGVGGYVAEALARSGIGALDLIDGDKVDVTNINRQILATSSTVGRLKTDVAAERIVDINPACKVEKHSIFYLPQTGGVDFSLFDYVVDAIDTVAGKLAIVKNAKAAGVPVISAMGAGNKLDPTAFEVADVYKTSVCPLARVMRRELKKMGIDSLKVVYSREVPASCNLPAGSPNFADSGGSESSGSGGLDSSGAVCGEEESEGDATMGAKKVAPASNSFVPPVVGLIIASEVIKDIIGR